MKQISEEKIQIAEKALKYLTWLQNTDEYLTPVQERTIQILEWLLYDGEQPSLEHE